ncbi:MAG: RHS repeat domain-containing protein [Blastocatellales bacterium]
MTAPLAMAPQKEYGYRGGKLLIVWDGTQAGDDQLKWLVTDHLGSTRMEVNKSGSLTGIRRHDYLPFGEELVASTGAQRSGVGYEPPQSGVRQRFTGYERDNETSLNYAQARYFNSVQGRFTSPDPLMSSARIQLPYSWNRYIYCYNNPIKYIDPDGMDVRFLNVDALQIILKTLPQKIQAQVKAKVDKNGILKKGALDKIKNTDGNFMDLKAVVNANGTIEVLTASEPGDGTSPFIYQSSEEAKAEIIENMIKAGSTRQEALDYIAQNPSSIVPGGKWGRTIASSESPTGNIRAVIADGQGASADMPEIERVVTGAHELYGHALPQIRNMPWRHEDDRYGPVNTQHKRIEDRTRRNYKQNQNLPAQVKPRQ